MTKLKLLLFINLIYSLVLQVSYGQNSLNFDTKVVSEKINITTDRNLYATGENLYFKTFYTTQEELRSLDWSTVVYIELIKLDGHPVYQGKFPLTKQGAWGSIIIPENILSGNYILKSYTKWMRNLFPADYAFTQIKIVNPSNPAIYSVNTKDTSGLVLLKVSETEKIDGLSIDIDSIKFGRRANVRVSLNLSNPIISKNEYCISVVKKGSKNCSETTVSSANNQPVYSNDIKYFPEINGLSLSGKLYSSNNTPVSNTAVYLSILNGTVLYAGYKTNENGKFFFNLPYSSHLPDFYISSSDNSDKVLIDIDKEFCQEPLNFTNINGFEFTENEMKVMSEIVVNSQIANKFLQNAQETNSKDSENKSSEGFYGAPQKQWYTKDYIDLPNIGEFIFEIIPELLIRYQKKTPTITTTEPSAFSHSPFLTMVDNITYPDLESFLKIKTHKIERIDVIYKSYLVGNFKYSGIINIISKNKDIAGIDLPDNSMFFNYKLFSDNGYKGIEHISTSNTNMRLPDRRNCLYWNPCFKIDLERKSDFSFYTADISGEYEIIVQTISKQTGELLTSKKSFVVK